MLGGNLGSLVYGDVSVMYYIRKYRSILHRCVNVMVNTRLTDIAAKSFLQKNRMLQNSKNAQVCVFMCYLIV